MGLGQAACGQGNKQSKVNSLEYDSTAPGNGIGPGEPGSLPHGSRPIIIHLCLTRNIQSLPGRP